MNIVIYEGIIWGIKSKGYHQALLNLLRSKDKLVVLKNGKAPYKVVIGVPHQAAVGVGRICENGSGRDRNRLSDENAASYALVAFEPT